ncbi:Hypothetical protein CINCED_3A010197 [Cinara cedri]|uniref:Uncharacterized protein n=1 Tax=Cinara cedri TaxID=506608 RepID=A0A5E4NA87_9HEMI|nr:Hypothetical protein CINCED_3A010197 [Cinara cedri]
MFRAHKREQKGEKLHDRTKLYAAAKARKIGSSPSRPTAAPSPPEDTCGTIIIVIRDPRYSGAYPRERVRRPRVLRVRGSRGGRASGKFTALRAKVVRAPHPAGAR